MKQAGATTGRLTVRVILALAAAGCAVPAYRYAEVAALRTTAPLDASKIAPHDAKVLANVLGSQFDSNPDFTPSAGDRGDIRTALARQPLEPKLLGILGLAYEGSRDAKRAAETMRLANRASRRDSVSGLYLIESASASGDVKATLRQYNAVLSTQPELNAALLPILSSAIGYREIRAELRQYLQISAKWVPAFLAIAAEKSRLTDLQALLLPLPEPLLSEEYAPILASVLHRFAIEGDRDSAVRFAVAAIPGLSVASLSNLTPGPATRDKRLGLFAWTYPPNDGIRVEVGNNQSLQISVDPLARGAVATRDLLLVAGAKYQLVQQLEYDPELAKIDARWSADCVTPLGITRFWEQRLPPSGAVVTYHSKLVVPKDCKLVRMTLFAEGPDGQTPATLTLTGLLLSRVNEI